MRSIKQAERFLCMLRVQLKRMNKRIKTNAIMTMETGMLEYSQQVYVVVEVVVFIVVVVVLFIVVVVVVVALWSKMEKNTDKIAI